MNCGGLQLWRVRGSVAYICQWQLVAEDYVWRVVDLLDFRQSLVDRMENTERLLKTFSHGEQQ